jgi:hypothetical protein
MDELERLRARNAELEAALAKGAPNLVTRPEPPTFKRSDLRDAAFFAAHRKDILDAASHGRIIDDLPAGDLESAIANQLRPTAPPDKERARLESIARGFVPDPASEDALKARAKDPERYDRAMEAMHVSGLDLALYERQRSAAIATGAYQAASTTKEGTK